MFLRVSKMITPKQPTLRRKPAKSCIKQNKSKNWHVLVQSNVGHAFEKSSARSLFCRARYQLGLCALLGLGRKQKYEAYCLPIFARCVSAEQAFSWLIFYFPRSHKDQPEIIIVKSIDSQLAVSNAKGAHRIAIHTTRIRP